MPPRRDPLRDQLSVLAALRDQPLPRPDEPGYAPRQSLLRAALCAKSSFAVAAAADLLYETDKELLALLADAFARFLKDPLQTDKGCTAKTAIARALERVDTRDDSVFLRGLSHAQLEPVWGGKQDTAVELRALCALGLARLSPPGVLDLLAELLTDKECGARAGAARALGCTGLPGAGPLLRYKALCGDDNPLVLTETLAALLLLERSAALPFVRRFLSPQDETRADAAALALGQSRLLEAIPALIEYADVPPRVHRKAALVALAMLRVPAATEHLMERVREADAQQAALAVEALALHRYDRDLRRRVEEAVAARSGRGAELLAAALARSFVD